MSAEQKMLPLLYGNPEGGKQSFGKRVKGFFGYANAKRLDERNPDDRKILEETAPLSYAAKKFMKNYSEKHTKYNDKNWFNKFGYTESGSFYPGYTAVGGPGFTMTDPEGDRQKLHERFQSEKKSQVYEGMKSVYKKMKSSKIGSKLGSKDSWKRVGNGALDAGMFGAHGIFRLSKSAYSKSKNVKRFVDYKIIDRDREYVETLSDMYSSISPENLRRMCGTYKDPSSKDERPGERGAAQAGGIDDLLKGIAQMYKQSQERSDAVMEALLKVIQQYTPSQASGVNVNVNFSGSGTCGSSQPYQTFKTKRQEDGSYTVDFGTEKPRSDKPRKSRASKIKETAADVGEKACQFVSDSFYKAQKKVVETVPYYIM